MTLPAAEDCIFCRIVTGELPADLVYRDDLVMAFKDIHPRAPVHLLVIPREHIGSLAHLVPGHWELAGRLLEAAGRIAREQGVEEAGYRVVANTGPDSGSEVSHLHLHILAGRKMGPMG